MRETVSERAWVQAMLDVEAAIARAEASVGLIPGGAAAEIVAHCRVAEFDVGQIGRDAVESANPVVPLVKALREKVGGEAANHVHRGATSQDVLDTAMMLVASRAIAVMLDDLGRAAAAAASLAERYRSVV
ncbi:MAG: 3-carboxy-cis,cis-muconate cycloisomerase, partial [Chloroflexi bacterium]